MGNHAWPRIRRNRLDEGIVIEKEDKDVSRLKVVKMRSTLQRVGTAGIYQGWVFYDYRSWDRIVVPRIAEHCVMGVAQGGDAMPCHAFAGRVIRKLSHVLI